MNINTIPNNASLTQAGLKQNVRYRQLTQLSPRAKAPRLGVFYSPRADGARLVTQPLRGGVDGACGPVWAMPADEAVDRLRDYAPRLLRED